MKTYEVEVTREGRWWMLSVPSIDGLTQARHVAEIPLMARELIAVQQGEKLDDVAVSVRYNDINGVSGQAIASLEHNRRLAAAVSHLVAVNTAALARALVAAKVPLREIGELIGVSHQRVHQLVSGAAEGPATQDVGEAEVVDLVAALRTSVEAARARGARSDPSA